MRSSFWGLVLRCRAACVSQTAEPSSDANLTPRDRKLLANPPYAQAPIPEPYLRHIVDYHRREAPGTIVVDSDARYLYYVLQKGKAIRYGVTVGEEALAFSGIAKVGARKNGRPGCRPPTSRSASATFRTTSHPARTIRSARAAFISSPATRTRCTASTAPTSRNIIGSAISSGCIRMTNEDVIDLYNRDQDRRDRGGAGARPGRLAEQSAHGAGRRIRPDQLI